MKNKTLRKTWDWYPTPHNATSVLRNWLVANAGLSVADSFLDPAAGDGSIVTAMRDCDALGECHWSAIEIDASLFSRKVA